MTSETDNISHRIHVDRRRSASAAEPQIDDGGGSSGQGSSHDDRGASEDETNSRRGDDSLLELAGRRQTQNECLYAMKEDLADWLGALYGVDIGADEFFEKLETGVLLCRHANAVHDRLCRKTRTNSTSSQNADDSSKSCNTALTLLVGQ